jgi:hypothetical protein
MSKSTRGRGKVPARSTIVWQLRAEIESVGEAHG